MANFKCPVCKKEWSVSLQVARHVFGTGDKAHRAWVDSQGVSFVDLLVEQATNPGNKSYNILAELIEKAQSIALRRKNTAEGEKTMQIEGRFTVRAPIQKLWDALFDVQTLASCLPGAEKVEQLDEKTYEVIMKQKVGPIKVRLYSKNVLTKVEAPTHLELEGEGEDMTKLGHVKQKAVVDMKDLGGGDVEVSYTFDVNMVGKLAMFGDRIMRSKAKDVEKEFTANLQEKLKALA